MCNMQKYSNIFIVVNGTLNVNYYGTTYVTEAILPLINNNGRIIMTSSRAGLIHRGITDKDIESKLLSNDLTQNYLEDLLKKFKDEVSKDKSLKNTYFKQSMSSILTNNLSNNCFHKNNVPSSKSAIR